MTRCPRSANRTSGQQDAGTPVPARGGIACALRDRPPVAWMWRRGDPMVVPGVATCTGRSVPGFPGNDLVPGVAADPAVIVRGRARSVAFRCAGDGSGVGSQVPAPPAVGAGSGLRERHHQELLAVSGNPRMYGEFIALFRAISRCIGRF